METLTETDKRLEQPLEEWAVSLIERHGYGDLSLLPYNPENESQRTDVVKLEPWQPSIERAYEVGCMAIGPENFGPIMGDLRGLKDCFGYPHGAMRQIKSWLGVRDHNVIVTTNHVDLLDIAIAQTALYRALEDDDVAYQSGIIVNKALSRIAYKGTPVVDLLRNNGGVYFNLPKSAHKFGITSQESTDFNRRMIARLSKDLKKLSDSGKSMLLAMALSGSTAIRDDELYIQIPDVDTPTEKLVIGGSGRFRLVLPIAIYYANILAGKDWYVISHPEVLGGSASVDRLMEEMAATTSGLADRPIVYKNFSVMGQSAIKKYIDYEKQRAL